MSYLCFHLDSMSNVAFICHFHAVVVIHLYHTNVSNSHCSKGDVTLAASRV